MKNLEPYREELIRPDSPFPVDIFLKDNLKENIIAHPHWHDCIEILYILDGITDQQVNNNFFRVKKNDMIILNQGDIHSTYCIAETNTRILVIKFLSGVIDRNYSPASESKYIHAFLNNSGDKIYHISDTLKNSGNIYNIMMGLYHEYTNKEPGYEIYIKGYIFQLIACLIRDGIINVYNLFEREQDFIKVDPLLKYIEKHYMDGIDLQKAADLLHLSYSYFSRYFKKVTGKTFKEYIDFVKICEVEKLILCQGMNVSQAAYAVGFSNIPSFNRVFKRVRGYLPGNLKKSKNIHKN